MAPCITTMGKRAEATALASERQVIPGVAEGLERETCCWERGAA
jgi:hypothetical protein